MRRVEQRLRTVEREIDAVLAALDSLADTEAAAAGELGADNAPLVPEPCGLGGPPEAQAVPSLPADRPRPVEQRAHGPAVGGLTSAAAEVERRGAAAAGSSPAAADAEEQGAAEQGLQAAMLRQRLVDLEAQQRRLQVPGRPSTFIHELVWYLSSVWCPALALYSTCETWRSMTTESCVRGMARGAVLAFEPLRSHTCAVECLWCTAGCAGGAARFLCGRGCCSGRRCSRTIFPGRWRFAAARRSCQIRP